jgi:pyruvate formate lyase activating enzyme
MEGLIFNIKRFAIHDGPGIRVTLFLKGCPLQCWWCHNPEGISPSIQDVERVDRIGEKEKIVIERVGRKYSVSELVSIVERDRVFIDESHGGVTFSGGEPLMQSDFLKKALEKFKEHGIHTAVDTSGYATKSVIDSILDVTDLFLFDIKHMDPEKHKYYTGVSNRQILENYSYIIGKGRSVYLRLPIIPGYNDDKENMERTINYINGFPDSSLTEIDLLPYHRIGSSKYKRFGLENRMEGTEQPTSERMNKLKAYFSTSGIKTKIGG